MSAPRARQVEMIRGYLNPDIRYRPAVDDKQAVATVTLRERQWDTQSKDQDGRFVELEPHFHDNVTFFGKQAERLMAQFERGDALIVTGETKMREFVNENNETVQYNVFHVHEFGADASRSTVEVVRPKAQEVAQQQAATPTPHQATQSDWGRAF